MTARLALLALAGALAAGPAPAAEEHAWDTFRVVDVAEGVFTFVSPVSPNGLVTGNSTVVAGDDGVLVFDSGNFPSLTRRMIAEIGKRTTKPVRFVVNSHWHFDHANGNSVYREAFPSVTIVDHDFTREKMAQNFEKFDRATADALAADMARLERRLEEGKRSDGTPLTEDDRRTIASVRRDEAGALPEYRSVKLELADVTFADALTVHLGKREVRLLHLGRGNTAGDVVAFVPDVRVLLAGDTVVLPTPYGYGAYPTEWVRVLEKIEAMKPAVLVPGHGPIQRDTAYLTTLKELLRSVATQVAELAKEGAAVEDVKKRIELEPFRKKLAGDDAPRRRAFDSFFVSPIVDRAYQEAKGALAPE